MPHIIPNPDQEAQPATELLSAERLAEIKSLLRYESSVSFHSARAKESLLLLLAEVELWRATYGREPLRGTLDRLNAAEAERDRLKAENHAVWTEHGERFRRDVQVIDELRADNERLKARVADLEQAAQSRHCGRAMVHPEHRWMSDREAVQCPGTEAEVQ